MKLLVVMLVASVLLLYGCTQNSGNVQNAIAAGTPGTPSATGQTQSGANGQVASGAAGSAAGGQPDSGVNSAPSVQTDNGTGAAGGNPAGAGSTVKEFTVEASDWQFSPSTITVNKGDTVRITLVNKDVSHGIAVREFNFSLKADAGQSATGEFVASTAGTYSFFCNVFCGEGHRGMTGTLVVK
ncbi:Nitrous-oxide reductase [Candidatus Anstonella stagnisolia]|nr:Nitrous-oxide reductase [Candidatus Anstonella stagnisolia]